MNVFILSVVTTLTILKLTDAVDLSWWWVLSPAIGIYGLILFISFVAGAVNQQNAQPQPAGLRAV